MNERGDVREGLEIGKEIEREGGFEEKGRQAQNAVKVGMSMGKDKETRREESHTNKSGGVEEGIKLCGPGTAVLPYSRSPTPARNM